MFCEISNDLRRAAALGNYMLSDAAFVHSVWHFGCNLAPQKQNSDSVWVSLAALGSCQLHFDNVPWQCLLACQRFNLCFHEQQIFGRFPRKQMWPAVLCCSSSAVESFDSADQFHDLVQVLAALSSSFVRKQPKNRRENCLTASCQSGCVHLRSIERARYATKHLRDTDRGSDYVMKKKPSRCWLGAAPRYWKVVASCFQNVSFAENTSAPLAPRARIFQPILLLFFCFLALEFVYKSVCQISFIPSQI